jgi:hypothetical protein
MWTQIKIIELIETRSEIEENAFWVKWVIK